MTRLRFRNPCFTLITLLLVSVGCGSPTTWSEFEPALDRFGAMLAEGVATDSVGAISAGVVVGDELIWAEGFGMADRELRIPADAGTIYRTGSISKSFTAVVMAQLAEGEILNLEDPVEKYLPVIDHLVDRPEDAEPITLRQLASHRSDRSLGGQDHRFDPLHSLPVPAGGAVLLLQHRLRHPRPDHLPGGGKIVHRPGRGVDLRTPRDDLKHLHYHSRS